MVKLAGVAAVNSRSESGLISTEETAEALERRIGDLYNGALGLQAAGESTQAAVRSCCFVYSRLCP